MSEDSDGRAKEEMPSTEVVVKAKRKRFTAAEKLQALREVDACQGSGEIGVLLRREWIYSCYLTTWRRQWERGELDGLAPQRRGPKPNPEAIELAKLHRENARLQERLRRAELIIDVQKSGADVRGRPGGTRPFDKLRAGSGRPVGTACLPSRDDRLPGISLPLVRASGMRVSISCRLL